MTQGYRIGGAAALALLGLVLLLYMQTVPGHVVSPCTFTQGLIHCSAPYQRGMTATRSSHPLLLLGVALLISGGGLGGWAVIAARSRAKVSGAGE